LFFGCRKRAESDPTVPDAPVRAEKFAQRYPFFGTISSYYLCIYSTLFIYCLMM
jgi:hypothetical protein